MRGRPPISEPEKRKTRALRLNDAETKLVNEAAKREGVLAAVWRRDTLLTQARKVLSK